MYLDVEFTIASGGTVSTANVVPAGYRLQSLNVPTLTSSTLLIGLSNDGTTFRAPFDAAGSLETVQSASTGNRIVVLSETLSRATEGRSVRLTAGTAQASAVTIVGRCIRTEA